MNINQTKQKLITQLKQVEKLEQCFNECNEVINGGVIILGTCIASNTNNKFIFKIDSNLNAFVRISDLDVYMNFNDFKQLNNKDIVYLISELDDLSFEWFYNRDLDVNTIFNSIVKTLIKGK